MNVQALPVGKAAERVVLFKDQVVSDGQNLFVALRETGFEILNDTSRFPDLVQQITRTIETSLNLCDWHRTSFCRCFCCLLVLFLIGAGWYNLTCLWIQFPD